MSEIREEVIVSVSVDKADAAKQVDTLTSRIGALKKETEDLVKTNKELAKGGKENSKEYLDNAKQIEINKQKITENTASRKSLVTTIIAEDNSSTAGPQP
jgi:regulator of replication initiation timing